MTQHDNPTILQQWIALVAAALAENNPDAAEELGWRLVEEAERQKRPRGCGFAIRLNSVTGQVEMTVNKPLNSR